AVSAHNDADAAGLGEARFGAGIGRSPILYVTIGSGIGGGLIVDGRIYRGAGAGAIEIGHLWIVEPLPSGGSRLTTATLERIASGWSIGRLGCNLLEARLRNGVEDPGPLCRLVQGHPERVTAAVVAEAARLGDDARSILQSATRAMGQALAHAVTLLAPRRIILGGGVSQIGEDLWFGPIRRALHTQAFPPFRGTFDLVPASLGEVVVVHGALALARDAVT